MDVQMAVFYCADSFLKQLMVTKLSQCQYALPLLVPDPFTQEIEFPLWTFRQINKSWKMKDTNNEISQIQPVWKAETPMVFFFRFGSVSLSKSQLMNSLINEKHNMFFHRNCPGSSKARLLMDGVVEIAWYCPSGKDTDKFTQCIAFCNLHGDAGDHEKQLQILTEMASINVVILPRLDRNDKDAMNIQNLYKDKKPLICLFTEDESTATKTKKGKYKIGLKDRNQSDVCEELRRAINDCLSESSSNFRLEHVSKYSGIRVDEEHDDDCRRGKEVAQQMMSLLENKKLTEIKESFLPCQGKLWHQWCEKNKELHRFQRNETEIEICRKHSEMKKIRHEQYNCNIILNLKENNDRFEQHLGINLRNERAKLERISKELQAATFGLEHILREIGQIYESCQSLNKNKEGLPCDFSSLPSLAAEMMISGFPLELMDGDAAHVPVVWVTAVLHELIQKLGDQRVFVLSVLGIQSSGKSTMLNTMFGLQFAVSAGRCTRGAFMQLVRVSNEMKEQLKFDYILVVDTEGLHALELSGRSTRHDDNELATFVVGLGSMTLINIFGENPAEMQDILQIVVQAFMRMKKVRLNPCCMFVHQNISDVTAGEKNMEGRRRLQESLDEMTKLAAKEEVYDAQCFNDVITFDIQKDVKYFAQLWEGSPPMAPPNPDYYKSVQDLKKSILSHVSKSDGIMLIDFKDRIKDLWKALMNEQFVFSFKNSLEISTYRKLETEYSKWSWSLCSAMLEIENKLHIKIENEWKASYDIKIKKLQENIVEDTSKKLNEIHRQREMKKEIDAQRTHHINTLFEKSKELALKLKDTEKDKETLKKEFDLFWEQSMVKINTDKQTSIRDIDVFGDMKEFLSNNYESVAVDASVESRDIFSLTSYSDYVLFKKSSGIKGHVKHAINSAEDKLGYTLSKEDETQIRTLVNDIVHQTEKIIMLHNIATVGYNKIYIQELIDYIMNRVKEHQDKPVKYVFKNEFCMDLVYSICKRANQTFTDQHRLFREASDSVLYVEKKREEYYSIFQKHLSGATSTAIFGEIICQKLKEPAEQSVYKNTARTLTDQRKKIRTGETHHEYEMFSLYMKYIRNPRYFFKIFINVVVSQYIADNFSDSVLPKIKDNTEFLQKKIMEAAHESNEHVQVNSGDVCEWLKCFTEQLSDVLIFSVKDLSGVSRDGVDDFKLLEQVIKKELNLFDVDREINADTFVQKLNLNDRPDEILSNELSRCCWAQCPFCGATCTNSVENHPGDHSVLFHWVTGLNGYYFDDTQNLCADFCSTVVASKNLFKSSDEWIPYKEYRRAGEVHAEWHIRPDFSELLYWKWFVCRFQKDLENHYEKSFQGK
ncbi:hypothetical protein M9458_051742, partial [Cirrhinus mrigala]